MLAIYVASPLCGQCDINTVYDPDMLDNYLTYALESGETFSPNELIDMISDAGYLGYNPILAFTSNDNR